MTAVPTPVPALSVVTRPFALSAPLLDYLDQSQPLLWLRRGNGLVGHGEALRLEFSGANRFADASVTWREVAARAVVDDAVGVAGSGLVALGTFAFDDESVATSTLIVPSLVIGRRDGLAWVTRIALSSDTATTDAATTDASPPAPSSRTAVTEFGDPEPANITGLARATFASGTLSPAGYLDAVERAVDGIRHNGVSKIVVARDLTATLDSDAGLAPAIASLAHGYPDCWNFAVDGFLGSSPETLVTVHRGTVTARVLAGSAARGADAASDVEASIALATSTKDQDEHEFAVHSVVAALRSHGTVTASEVPFTLKLPNLWHLASDVEGTLSDGSTSLDLIAALHPTAAVAGTPTDAAIDAIRELEPFDRERYAGPVGWVGADGDGEWAIALRSAQLAADGTITAWAGAGIVVDSVPQHELAETTMKFRPIVEAFGG
ncbi:MAG: isochorismate synthase [Cryobacterium sp.]|nr:isochorismate synthase [Cryobacterium sp.]